ncbi:MAG: DUF4276 family protein [Candidatus Poribacteria bacterium]|nr:DUF4276 family protein [Candidatus Poribacteria bacterium]
MHIEFLLEERSAEVVLQSILPKILPVDVSFYFHVFEDKQDLLKKLSARLKGYSTWIPNDWRIMVLIDEDRQNCHELKTRLENAAHEAGFVTKSSTLPYGDFQVVNRLAIEELEAWFFGDIAALREAYPKVSKSLQYNRKYRNPDAIAGGTYEALERLLKRSYKRVFPKTSVARNIAPHMEPDRNRSKSFQVFVEGLKACIGGDS